MKDRLKEKISVLFMCLHNSIRSPIAEGWLKHLHGDEFEVQSAGLEPRPLSPVTVALMQEVGVDLRGKQPQRVFDLVRQGALFSYAITLCDRSDADRRPYFPGFCKRIYWDFPNSSGISGREEELAEKISSIRDAVRIKIEEWYQEIKEEQRRVGESRFLNGLIQ
jgi:arsenate reductase (thioredoxin)